MKKTIIILLISFLILNSNTCYANYDGYKSYLKGLFALKYGNIDLAIEEYTKVLSFDKNAISIYKELANIYWQKGNGQKALEMTKKLQEIDGESIKTNTFLGTFYLSANEMDLAKQSWEKILKLDPKNETATVYLAAYYYSDNKLKESADYWNKFLQQQPESSEGYFQLGLVQEKLGMLTEALESYKKVNELKPEAREAYLARARIYETKKQYNLAVQEYEKYIEVFPDNISILLYLGKCYFEEKRYSDSENILIKAKKIAPNNITLHYLLGMVYEKQANIDKAIDTFEYIAKNEPTSPAFARLGYYYALKQNFKKAEFYINKAIELEPFNPEFFYLAGLNYIDIGNYNKAKLSLEKSLTYKPDFIDAKFYLAMVNDKLNNFTATELLLKEILKVQPNNVKVLNYLGYSYAEQNIKLDEAEQLLKKVIEISPNDSAFLDSLAWLYYRTSKYQEAEKYIFMAINTEPILLDSTLYEHLGDISIELNKLPQAWLSYAVASDIGSISSRKKMKLVENKIPKEDVNKVVAERAIHNFRRIVALKAGYKLKIKTPQLKTNSFLSVLYGNKFGLTVNVAQKFSMPAFSIFFNNGQIEFSPQAIKDILPDDVIEMFNFANFVLSKDFIKILYSSKIVQNGNTLIYSNKDYVIKINKKTGMFEEFTKNGLLQLKISSYKQFNKISKIPSKLIFNSKKNKFNCSIILTTYSFPDKSDFNTKDTVSNDNKSSGKN
ncbi:MAG: tetratricopeptide repeat protein [Endomicrobiaceae bacterium]|nr:tetratricopeptide repeat protein [Endomicrobiaceae bacterium]MDD3053770.1 tetratricopeptide repeat protein [Endomicrobiaceae bacterium]MDD3923079.1 tetratricopeptide repeat protein [Endomicrobiaceae bacterium]